MIIKNKRILKGVIVGTMAASIFVGGIVGLSACSEDKNIVKENQITTSEKVTHNNIKTENNQLDFYSIKYGDKTYLTIDEEDMLDIIEKSMKEVDEEYVKNGNKTVFNSQDKEYSQFSKYDILGLLYTESSLRLLEVNDKNKGSFNVQNYSRFHGQDAQGVVYNGPGMMNKEAVEYIVNNDRLVVNNFKEHDHIKINNKQVKISFENLNPYDYVIQSEAKTEKEIKKALEECLSLNTKCIYIYLNRLVKDNVKAGTHDVELNILKKYGEFKNLSTEEKQIAFAMIAYNNGPSVTRNKMLEGKLFEKDKEGNYLINVKYASKVRGYSQEYYNTYNSMYAK